LQHADPAIRWQVLRDVVGADAEVVAAERARVADEGWGARLLALADDDGLWQGGALFPRRMVTGEEPFPEVGQPWNTTSWALSELRDFGVDPADERVRRAVDLVRENARWEHDNQPFFDGEVEACINGRTVANGAYFGQDVSGIVERLLGEQMADGGWNCELENGSVRGSFHSTIEVLEGLLAYERATGPSDRVTTARLRAHEYLLERGLLRRVSDGAVIDDAFTQLSYPPRWHYDVLRGLHYLVDAGVAPDARWDEALGIVRSKQQPDGRWLLENTHPGPVSFALEDGDGRPSRWVTLRALRVLG
jgi:hypothetical protein